METAENAGARRLAKPEPGESAAPPPPPEVVGIEELKRGDKLGGRFVVDARLGEDGMGTAWQAVDERSGKHIVLLVFDPAIAADRETTEHLREAVKTATALNHKNIVGTFGLGKEGPRRYLAREFVDGRPLTVLLERKAEVGKRFGVKTAYNLVAHVCHALIGAGDLGHGTLRPSSIFVNRAGRVRVTGFGLAQLRGPLQAHPARLDTWDRPFTVDPALPVAEADMRALGLLLVTLLAGRPASELALPELRESLPPGLADVIERCLDRGRSDRIKAPPDLKAALQPIAAAAKETGDESLEALAAVGPEVAASPPPPPPPGAPPTPSQAVEAGEGPADDGSLQRWLVNKGGTDFGPFNRKEVRTQLFAEEINAETVVFDIETDRRLSLSEFTAFEEDLRAWAHEKAEREKKKSEAQARARAKRRNRILFVFVVLPMLAIGVGVAGWFWYQSTLPTPQKAHLGQLVTPMQGALPAVPLPEELPETVEEKKARVKVADDAAATKRAQDEARQVAHEARLAEKSELQMGAGTGAVFDRAEFDRALQKRTGGLVKCLEDEARRDPELKSVEVKVTIIPSGELINTQLVGGSARGTSCVRQALGGLKVPAFDGTNHKVTLPFQIR